MLYSFLFGVFLLILMFILMPILEKCDLKRQELEFQEKYKQNLKICKSKKNKEKRLDRYHKRSIILKRKLDKKGKSRRLNEEYKIKKEKANPYFYLFSGREYDNKDSKLEKLIERLK